jgi:hypothetical protein
MRNRHVHAVVTAAFLALVVSVSGLIVAGHPAPSSASTTRPAAAARFNLRQLAFHDAMRKLWEEHVLWTRLFIVSDVFSLPDLAPTTARLLANQADIGNAVRPFYGAARAEHLTALLRRHILLAAKILAAAKAQNTGGVRRAERAWYANANHIAGFLHRLNPAHWPLASLRTMMRMHLNLTLDEAVAELTGRYAHSVAEFDAIEAEILTMADTLSNGIIAQFPGKFQHTATPAARQAALQGR